MDELERQAAIDRGDFMDEDDAPEVEEVEAEEEEVKEEDPKEEEPAEEEEEDEKAEDDDKEGEDEGDDSDSASEDEEPADEPKDEVEEEEDDGNARIPRSRLNQVIQQRKDKEAALEEEQERSAWLEDQLETMIKQRAVPEPEVPVVPEIESYDFDDAEDRRDQLLIEGEMKEASALRREITAEHEKVRQHQLETMRAEIATGAKTAADSTLSDSKFETAVTEILSSKDYLDDASDAYNERAVKMANSLMNSYVVEGMDRTKALAQAVEDIAPLFDEEEVSDKPVLGDKKASKRTKDARKKAADASNAQPPDVARSSSNKGARDIDNLNIKEMTEKDFGSLSKKEISILRGDTIA